MGTFSIVVVPDEEQLVVGAVSILNVETGQTDFFPLFRLGEVSQILAGKIHEHKAILFRTEDFDFLKSLGAFKGWHRDSKKICVVKDLAACPYEVDLPEIYQFNFERPFPLGVSELVMMDDSELPSATSLFCAALNELIEDNFISPFTYRAGSYLMNSTRKCAIEFCDQFLIERFNHWKAVKDLVSFLEENTVCKQCGAPAKSPFICCSQNCFSFSPELFEHAKFLSDALVHRYKAYKQQLRRQGRISKTPKQDRISNKDIEILRHVQNEQCFYCACDLNSTQAHQDHYTPLSRGGTHTLDNIVLACRACNMIKSDYQAGHLWAQLRISLGKGRVKSLQARARRIRAEIKKEAMRRN